jgi:hypothetical protein
MRPTIGAAASATQRGADPEGDGEPTDGATEDGVEVGWPAGLGELHAPAARESAARQSAHRLIQED